ncbi:SART-1 family-domain-containing protein [Lactarius quietus]|nr:SART-1 family-domain-containing protein [Lactarius quietus]
MLSTPSKRGSTLGPLDSVPTSSLWAYTARSSGIFCRFRPSARISVPMRPMSRDRQRQYVTTEQHLCMAQQEINHLKSHSSNKDQAQQEYENHIQEQQEAWGNLEAFKNYKPNTNIVYHNEFGHALDQKEAWKALSHKFHSKCSSKMKT